MLYPYRNAKHGRIRQKVPNKSCHLHICVTLPYMCAFVWRLEKGEKRVGRHSQDPVLCM